VTNRLAQLMREGVPAAGFWINLSDPAIVRIAALCGFDWVMIDTEHNPLGGAELQAMVYAAAGSETTVVPRVRGAEECHITWVLDLGVGGIVVPGIRDAAHARRAAAAAKYAPVGERGFGPNRASDFWSRGSEYVKEANREVLLICQVELASAVADVDAICDTPGVDGIWIGPGDLAQSLGHLADTSHPDVLAAIDQVIAAATRHGKPWGIPTGSVEEFERYARRGGTILTVGSDTRVLKNAGGELAARARKVRG
jgi:2-keto-3-deoxy-L-rhamnonate aldolase RhmA